MFYLSFLIVPSSRQVVSRDPVDFAFHLYLFFAFCLSPFAFAFCLCFYPVHPIILSYPDELVWTSTSCTPFLIAFASVFYYHISIREKMLDTVFLIAYN